MSIPSNVKLKEFYENLYAFDKTFKSIMNQEVHAFVSRNPKMIGREHLCRDFFINELDGCSRIGQYGHYLKIYHSSTPKILESLSNAEVKGGEFGL